ncbi:hypothetical protein CCDG5_0324 [[Clostridium] cellulosi]|uniref:Uncharacterized protein n=1 Tax=[Clostridium] cellulosi TaxID=29343 RepID=A0A078KIS0_9FIRM|nr:hypothetical protein CCDG5_0324 [[Clostridium] cellulosi]
MTEDLDAQIKAAFDFIDGNIKVTDKTIFDSDSMEDSIENGKFLYYTSIPTIIGIQTDKGRTYTIGYCEYFVNKDHPSYVGMMEIDITADDGRKCAIGKLLR